MGNDLVRTLTLYSLVYYIIFLVTLWGGWYLYVNIGKDNWKKKGIKK